MTKLYRNVALAALVFFVGCLATSMAFQQQQEPAVPTRPPAQAAPSQAPTQAPAESTKTFQGELVKVDAATKMIIVEGSNGTEMEFLYTDRTEITGQERGAQGLAAPVGTELKISYSEVRGINTATKIEILSKGEAK